jgi:hypothetical protein
MDASNLLVLEVETGLGSESRKLEGFGKWPKPVPCLSAGADQFARAIFARHLTPGHPLLCSVGMLK